MLKRRQKTENVEEMAKKAAHLQLGLNLLTPALFAFVVKKLEFKEKSDFSQIIRVILNNWGTFFPRDGDEKRKIFQRAIKIRNAVSHQVHGRCRYDEDLLCLVQIAEFIGERKLADKILKSQVTLPPDNLSGSRNVMASRQSKNSTVCMDGIAKIKQGPKRNVQTSANRSTSYVDEQIATFQLGKRELRPKPNIYVPVNRSINNVNQHIPLPEYLKFQSRPREPPSDKKKTSWNMGKYAVIAAAVFAYSFRIRPVSGNVWSLNVWKEVLQNDFRTLLTILTYF